MKLLTFSTLYPNSHNAQHGIFTQTSLRHVLKKPSVQCRVVAPVPWFPFTSGLFGKYAALAKCARSREANGLQIIHPRFPALPKVGQSISPWLLATAMIPVLQKIIDSGYDFDVIDAHYFYPDGVAAALLGRHFNKPVTIKALGSDINVLGQHKRARKAILWAAGQAVSVSAVSGGLKQSLIDLGVDGDKIAVLRNGVDLDLFRPLARDTLRASMGMSAFTLLSVGNLVESKGHHLAIEALEALPDVRLMIAGAGPERAALERLARRLGLEARVQFVGSVPQAKLVEYFNAADALVLASSREGWANVLLESMACGTPVVTTAIPGTTEVVCGPAAGVLFQERSAAQLAQAVNALRANYPQRQSTRLYAEQFSWDAPTAAQIGLYEQAVSVKRCNNGSGRVLPQF
jgi:glycosyltransferase involved in cell wall biosynthesis